MPYYSTCINIFFQKLEIIHFGDLFTKKHSNKKRYYVIKIIGCFVYLQPQPINKNIKIMYQMQPQQSSSPNPLPQPQFVSNRIKINKVQQSIPSLWLSWPLLHPHPLLFIPKNIYIFSFYFLKAF